MNKARLEKSILKFNNGLDIIFKNTKLFLKPAKYSWDLFVIFYFDFGLPLEKFPKERLTEIQTLYKLNLSAFTEAKIKTHMHKFIKLGLSWELLLEIIQNSITKQVTNGYSKKEVNLKIQNLNYYFKRTRTLNDVKKLITKYLTNHKGDFTSLWIVQKNQFLENQKELKRLINNKDTIIKKNNLYLKSWNGVQRKIKKGINAAMSAE